MKQALNPTAPENLARDRLSSVTPEEALRNHPANQLSFFGHLEELRVRLMRCLWVFFAGFGICYYFSNTFLAFLQRPLFNALPEEARKLYFTSLFEGFLTHLKISGYASLFFFSPYFFYELWKFVSPGLHNKEKRWVFPFVLAASSFFIGGAAFAYTVLFPIGFKYFVTYGGPTEVPLLTMDSYYSTCLKLMLLFGLAFELPVIVVFLGYLGLVQVDSLKKHRKNAILGITVASALFAPPDALSMVLLGGPLVLLYEASIWVVAWIEKSRPATPVNGMDPSSKTPPHAPKHPWSGASNSDH